MRVQLVVNQTRVRTDAELGAWMSGLVVAPLRRRARRARAHRARRHGVAHRAAQQAAPRRQPRRARARATSSASRAASSRSATAKTGERAASPPVPIDEPTLYAVLGVTRSASDEEIRRAYKRQREIYATGGLATSSLLDDDAARAPRSASSTRRTTRCSIRCAAAPTTCRRSPSPSRDVLSARDHAPGARRRAAHAPGGAAARDRARHRVHRARSCARCASRRGSSSPTSARKTKIAPRAPAGDRGRALRRSPGARLHARLPRRAREAAAPRPAAGPEDVPAPDARGARRPGARSSRERERGTRAEARADDRRALRRAALRRRARRRGSGSPLCVGGRAGVGRALLRLRRAAHRRGARVLRRSHRRRAARVAPVVPLPGRLQRVSRRLLPLLRRQPRRRRRRQRARRRRARRRHLGARAGTRSRGDARASRASSSRCTRGSSSTRRSS